MSESLRYWPTAAELATSPSFSITSSTARPAAHETGLPPKVLNSSVCSMKSSRISRVVTTTPSGCPLPTGFPMVTMSGTKPSRSWPHITPVRPKPAWTSSDTTRPPWARTAPAMALMNPRGTFGIPLEVMAGSTKNPASSCPASLIRPMAASASSATTAGAAGAWRKLSGTAMAATLGDRGTNSSSDISKAASVIPWYAPAIISSPSAPVRCFTIWLATSLASLPELTNKHTSRP